MSAERLVSLVGTGTSTGNHIALPTIHLNGSCPSHLLEEYTAALSAVVSAREALAKCSPNARDYYPQGDAAGRLALSEHMARLSALDAVADDLRKLARHVARGPK